jgi:hypothetical protein
MLIRFPIFDLIVTVGVFFSSKEKGCTVSLCLCILRCVTHNQVRVTWWLAREELIMVGNVEVPSPLGVEE